MAVVDGYFREKSLNKIKQFINQRKTIIIVSHWLDFLNKTCKNKQDAWNQN